MTDKQATSATAAIAAAIAAVMGEATRVPKNGKNKFHGYDYATEGDLLTVIRPAMAKHGLVLLPSQTEVSPADTFGNVTVRVEYTLAHASGAVWPEKLISHGVGNDRAKNGNDGDKAVYKAVTGANKYMLFKLFQVDTGDDPEAEETAADQRPTKAAKNQNAADAAVTTFIAAINKMLDAGATVEDLYKFEQENGNADRIKRLRGEFFNRDDVKETLERMDIKYAAAAG